MEYSTIQQHQPLRVPQSFDKQGRALVLQLDEIFDDIYRRFGRLKTTDLGSKLKDLILIQDENGKFVSVSATIDGLRTDIQDEFGNYYTKTETATEISTEIGDALGNYYTKSETASQISTSITSALGNYYTKTETATEISTEIGTALGDYYTKSETATQISTAITTNNGNYYTKTETASQISTAIGTALGDYSTTQQTAQAIALAVGDCYGKISDITINTTGIKLETSKILDLQSGCELRIRSGADIAIYSGGSMNVASGGSLSIQSGGTFSVSSTNFTLTSDNFMAFKGGGEILASRSLHVKSSGLLDIESGGNFYIRSGGNMEVLSGGDLIVRSGGSFEVYSSNFELNSSNRFFFQGGGHILADRSLIIDSTGELRIASGGDLNIKSGGNMTVESGGAMTINSGGNLEVKSGGSIEIKASGGTALLLDNSGIDMQTAGKAYIHAKDASNSAIIFGSDTSNANFSVGLSGDLYAKSVDTDSLTVNGNPIPEMVVANTQPSGNNIIWLLPNSTTEKQWTISLGTSDRYLSNSGGTLNYYKDYTVPYTANDYMAGNLYYGIETYLYVFSLSSSQNITLKARLQNGNSWIDIGSVTQMVYSAGTAVKLNVMLSATNPNLMSVSGGSFTIRMETNYDNAKCRMNSTITFKAKSTSSSSASACSVYYIP